MHRGTHTHTHTCSAQNHLEPISSALFSLSAQGGCVVCVVFLLSLLGFDRVSLESADRFFGLL